MNKQSARLGWVLRLPTAKRDDGLRDLVESGLADDEERHIYEVSADPKTVAYLKTTRRYRGQYLRRLRRRSEHERHDRRTG